MEYASFIWSPHTAVNINKLESVQRRAMRFVMSNYDQYSSVSDMLSMLHMSTLEGRQNAQSLSIFYKILNNLVDVSLPDCTIPSQVQNRGHNNKFIPIQPRIDVYKFSFTLEYFCYGITYLQTL